MPQSAASPTSPKPPTSAGDASVYCPSCLAETAPGSRYCKLCGASITTNQAPVVVDASHSSISAEIDSRRARQLLDRALNLAERNDLPAAILACRQAVALSPQSVDGHSRLGMLLDRAGDTMHAIQAYEKVLQLAPGSLLEREALMRLREAQLKKGGQKKLDDSSLAGDAGAASNRATNLAATVAVPAVAGSNPSPPLGVEPSATEDAQPATDAFAVSEPVAGGQEVVEANALEAKATEVTPEATAGGPAATGAALETQSEPVASQITSPTVTTVPLVSAADVMGTTAVGALAPDTIAGATAPGAKTPAAAPVAAAAPAVATERRANGSSSGRSRERRDRDRDRRNTQVPVAVERRRTTERRNERAAAPAPAAPAPRAQQPVTYPPIGGRGGTNTATSAASPFLQHDPTSAEVGVSPWQLLKSNPTHYWRGWPLLAATGLSLLFLGWAGTVGASRALPPTFSQLDVAPTAAPPAAAQDGRPVVDPSRPVNPAADGARPAQPPQAQPPTNTFPIGNQPLAPAPGPRVAAAPRPAGAPGALPAPAGRPAGTRFPPVQVPPASVSGMSPPIRRATGQVPAPGTAAGRAGEGAAGLGPMPSVRLDNPAPPVIFSPVLPPGGADGSGNSSGGAPVNPSSAPSSGFIRVTQGRIPASAAPSRPAAVARNDESRAAASARSGQTDAAINRLTTAIANSDTGDVGFRYQQRATLFLERNDYSRAADDFQSAIASYNDQISRGEDLPAARAGLRASRSGLNLALSGLRR